MYRRIVVIFITVVFFFQAEDGIRDLVRSRGLGDVYKRQVVNVADLFLSLSLFVAVAFLLQEKMLTIKIVGNNSCLLYTSDAADERSSVDLGGRRIIKKNNNKVTNR